MRPGGENAFTKPLRWESAQNSPEPAKKKKKSECWWTMANGQGQLCRVAWSQERTWGYILSTVANHRKALSKELTYFCF